MSDAASIEPAAHACRSSANSTWSWSAAGRPASRPRERGAPWRAHAAGGALRLPGRHGHGRRRDQLRRPLRPARRRDAPGGARRGRRAARAHRRHGRPQQAAGRHGQGRIRVRSYDTSVYKCAADQLLLRGRRRAAVPRLGRGRGDGRRRASPRWWSRPSPAARRSAPTPSSTAAAMPTWPPSPACPSRWATAMAAGSFPPPCSASAMSMRQRALAAVGEFKAINDADGAGARARARAPTDFPREGAILRPQIDPREWRANVTQIRNAAGRGDERRRCARAQRRRGRGPAPDRASTSAS